MGFENVTLGVGSLEINSRSIGLIAGDVNVTRGLETKDLEAEIPLKVQGRIPIRESHTITFPVVEMTIQNLSDVSLNIPVTDIAGTEVTVSDAANQERTFKAFGGAFDMEYIRLDGPNITASSLTVKNLAESTTYVENTDYFVDYSAGYVIIFPGFGSIASGATVRVDYAYTPNASSRLQFGVNLPLQKKEISFVHVSPNSGNIFTVFMPDAYFSGELTANFQTQEFMITNASASATPSASYPDYPLGFWDIEPAA